MLNLKSNKAITLIALVITIVILIILAGVLINVTLGNNGIINRAKNTVDDYKKAQYYEEINIEILEEEMERKTYNLLQILPLQTSHKITLPNKLNLLLF